MLARTSLLVALLSVVAACSDTKSPSPVDAAVQADAAPQSVFEVACPVTPALTVDAPDNMSAYVLAPAGASIPVGGIVQFTMHTSHNVVPNSFGSDPGLRVNYNATTCLKFMRAGSFGFHCAPHGFASTITVQ